MTRNELLYISKIYKKDMRYFVQFRVSFPCGNSCMVEYYNMKKSLVRAFLKDLDSVNNYIQNFVYNNGAIYLNTYHVRG